MRDMIFLTPFFC